MTSGEADHTIKFQDVHFKPSRNKILIMLHSSKTHSKSQKPQIVEIDRIDKKDQYYCPCKIICEYTLECSAQHINLPFFDFRDFSAVRPDHFRSVLESCITKLDLNPDLYDTHSLRKGRAKDLFKMGYSLDKIKEMGRWQSNAVYEYLK